MKKWILCLWTLRTVKYSDLIEYLLLNLSDEINFTKILHGNRYISPEERQQIIDELRLI